MEVEVQMSSYFREAKRILGELNSVERPTPKECPEAVTKMSPPPNNST